MYDIQYNNHRRSEFDWAVLICTFGLMCIGTAFIFSALEGHESGLVWYRQTYMHQVLWYIIGMVGAALLLLIECWRLARFASLFYWGSIISLVAVFVIGSARNGARRWILGVQPSEFAKMAFIFLLANFL